jgi:S-adenosylmethionine decarboxylase proenzyme
MTTDNRYAVDVRLFLATITVAMFASFLAGVGLNDASLMVANSATSGADHFTVRDSFPPALNEGGAFEHDQKEGIEVHKPAGQHLLVDMAGVDGEFLDSEERLSKAMVGVVQEAGLSMLSYHCHSLKPKGVSCVGVLLESHISFHTWPDEGVITLDLFTCGSNPLLPVVEVIENLFGIAGPGKELKTRWSHELRGFRSPDENHYLDDSSDLALWVLSPLELYYKKQIYSNTTTFQRVDIWDTVEASVNKKDIS